MSNDRTDDNPIRIEDRTPLHGKIDFTMMYAAHDAFSRDLERLLLACRTGAGWRDTDHARWTTFTAQLHIHHHAEDDALWPPLRATGLDAREVAIMDAMEREHAQIDPHLDDVRHAIAARDAAAVAAGLRRLRDSLAAHMRHEENAALPMIETHLGPAGWRAFTGTFRETQGIRGAAVYLPWLIEGATKDAEVKVLGMLPPPARLLYRTVWAPRYRRTRT
jgi:hypothetical protein